MLIIYDQDYEGLWEEDGCYNTSMYQKTEDYHTYQQVSLSSLLSKSISISLVCFIDRHLLFHYSRGSIMFASNGFISWSWYIELLNIVQYCCCLGAGKWTQNKPWLFISFHFFAFFLQTFLGCNIITLSYVWLYIIHTSAPLPHRKGVLSFYF